MLKYFLNNNAEGLVKARAVVKTVLNSNQLSPDESTALVQQNQNKLQLTDSQFKRWAGKRYLVLIEIENVTNITPFAIDKRDYSHMDDWLPVEDITRVKIGT